jgi:drug/metabolite transporter (DMT)-like permease
MPPAPLRGSDDATAPASGLLVARLAIVAAALLWSSSGLFAKAPVFDAWPVELRGGMLAFWRALFAGVLLVPLVRRPRWRPALVPMTVCFAVMNVVYLSAVTLTTAANAIWLQMTAPAWVLLFTLVAGDRVSRVDLAQIALGLLGIGVIVFSQGGIVGGQITGGNQLGILCALASGLTYGGVMMFLRRLRDENAAWLIALNHLVTAALLLPYVLYCQLMHGAGASLPQLGVLACFGFFQMGLPYVLFAYGLRRVPSQEAAGLGLLEPILMPLWVLLAWGETPQPATALGAVCILAGLTVRYAVAVKGQYEPPRRRDAEEENARGD